MSDDPTLRLDGVRLRRRGRDRLEGLNLEVAPGERVALLGPAGSGKTLLLHAIQGIERPQEGQVVVAGHDALKRPQEARRRIGWVPAEPAWYPHLTTAGLGQFLRGFYPSWSQKRYVDLLARLGVPPRVRADSLTPGVRQRLALAAALAPAPSLVLVDLPDTLDDPARERLLIAVHDEVPAQAALIVASRRAQGLAGRTDHVVVLAGGQLRFAGSQADALARLRALVVTGGQAPAPPEGVRSLGWAPIDKETGRWTVEVSSPAHLAALDDTPGLLTTELLDLEQAYVALAYPPPGPTRLRPKRRGAQAEPTPTRGEP